MPNSLTYRDAGVDIAKADQFLKDIRNVVKSTYRSGVIGDIGGFGGLFHLNKQKYQDPVLVSSTDGVGTKLKIAILMDKHDTIGQDLVAMCVNDILVHGATPLFFLDYLAMGHLRPRVAKDIVQGIAAACQKARCALIGGETAEMPGIYQEQDYDLAGFVVGVVERDQILDGSDIAVGQKLIGIASNGLHANGFSLVRKVLLEQEQLRLEAYLPDLGCTLGEELLRPTKIFVETILNLLRDFPLAGIAHITGGGLTDNVPRILPHSCQAIINRSAWTRPAIFQLIERFGKVPAEDMWRTFNNGIGIVLVVADDVVGEVLLRLQALKEDAFVIGEVAARKPADPPLIYQ